MVQRFYTLLFLGRISDLRIVASVALKHNPNESSIHFNFANALGKAASQGSGLFEESAKHFLTAIELNNKVATYHSNLGEKPYLHFSIILLLFPLLCFIFQV